MFDLIKRILKFALKFTVITVVIAILLTVFFAFVSQLPDAISYIVAMAAAFALVILFMAWLTHRD